MRGRNTDPVTASQMVVYALARGLAISPLEVYKMPPQMVVDFLAIHGEVEKYKNDEMERMKQKVK